MSRQRNSINNLVWGIIGNLITSIVAIVIPRLFIVNYGSEINGLLASIRQIYVYLALLEIGVGDASVVALYGPIARQDHKSVNEILAATDFYYKKNRYYLCNQHCGIRIGLSIVVKYECAILGMFLGYRASGGQVV